MIVERTPSKGIGGGTHCCIWLDEPVPADFPQKLLTELLALARPAGLGHIEAYARRAEDQATMLTLALDEAVHDGRGRRHYGNLYDFDYVSGYRIKVNYWPEGLPADYEDPDDPWLHPDLPLVSSVEFEEMYGTGTLEGAVRLALTG